MWTRAELKQRAKDALRRYYWWAVLVGVLFGLVGGTATGGGTSSANLTGSASSTMTNRITQNADGLDGTVEGGIYNEFDAAQSLADIISRNYQASLRLNGNDMMGAEGVFWTIFLVFMLAILAVGLVLAVFVTSVMEVGKNRFYMESRLLGRSAGVGKLLWGFQNGYLRIVKTMFLRGLITSVLGFLGSLISLVGLWMMFFRSIMEIPLAVGVMLIGIVPSVAVSFYCRYSFLMVPYILAENPEMKAMDAIRLSREMMKGQKWKTFVLSLSFIGWEILGAIFCGIGMIFVTPYIDATFAELYAVLRRPYDDGRMNGFGIPEPAYGGGYNGYNGGYESGGYGSGYGDNNYNGSYKNGGYPGQNPGGYQNNGWNPGYPAGQNGQGYPNMPPYPNDQTYAENQNNQNWSYQQAPPQPDMDVKRSEGGPGNGYYLNGEFHPYVEDGDGNNQK